MVRLQEIRLSQEYQCGGLKILINCDARHRERHTAEHPKSNEYSLYRIKIGVKFACEGKYISWLELPRRTADLTSSLVLTGVLFNNTAQYLYTYAV